MPHLPLDHVVITLLRVHNELEISTAPRTAGSLDWTCRKFGYSHGSLNRWRFVLDLPEISNILTDPSTAGDFEWTCRKIRIVSDLDEDPYSCFSYIYSYYSGKD